MEHNARYEISAWEINNGQDFSNAIQLIIDEAIWKFNQEIRIGDSPIDFASMKIVCGFSMERGSFVVDVSARNYERGFFKK